MTVLNDTAPGPTLRVGGDDADRPDAQEGAGRAGRKGRLDNLPSAPRLTGEQAAAHSALVRRLRVILPLFGAVLIVVFFANARRDAADNVFLDEFKDIDTAAEELRMAEPRFSGVDAEGVPYDITADAAIQAPGGDKQVRLERPRAVSGDTAKRSIITADKGAFSSETNILELQDDVRFEHQLGEDNYVLRAPAATFSIDEETVTSKAGVAGEGPRGATLEADTMFADNKAGRVVFEGNVRMRIYPDRERAARGEPAGEAETTEDNAVEDGAAEDDAGEDASAEDAAAESEIDPPRGENGLRDRG